MVAPSSGVRRLTAHFKLQAVFPKLHTAIFLRRIHSSVLSMQKDSNGWRRTLLASETGTGLARLAWRRGDMVEVGMDISAGRAGNWDVFEHVL